MTISRADLGAFQLRKIKKASNIDIVTEGVVKKIDKTSIFIEGDKEIKFKYLVGADGSESIVKQSLKLKTEYFIGIYYEIPKITGDYSFYLNPDTMGTGYIWTFPHQKVTNIGIYYNPQQLATPAAKKILTGFAKKIFS